MSAFSIQIDEASLRHLTYGLLKAEEAVLEGGKAGVQLAAELAFDQAQTNVPVKSGALRDSGAIADTGNEVIIERTISYGTDVPNPAGVPTSAYAVARHEIPNKKNPAAYKWLETAVRDVGSELLIEAVSSEIDRALKSG
jgi:hypothetical protein